MTTSAPMAAEIERCPKCCSPMSWHGALTCREANDQLCSTCGRWMGWHDDGDHALTCEEAAAFEKVVDEEVARLGCKYCDD